jgi:cold-inducible RNA-binding protein
MVVMLISSSLRTSPPFPSFPLNGVYSGSTAGFVAWAKLPFVLLFRRPFMGKKLYVGNLTYGVNDSDLQQMFAAHGTVQSAQVIMDRDTGRSKGFGFVEMGSDQEAQAAISALNGKEHDGRALTVNEARPKAEGGGRGGSGGGRGYGGGGGGGRRY